MLQWFHSGIFRKIFFAMLTVSFLPVLILGSLALRSGDQAGEASSALSRKALSEKAQEALEVRAYEAAQAIAWFLEEREADLRLLAKLPVDEVVYVEFFDSHLVDVWWEENGKEHIEKAPIYFEIAFISPEGQEVLKVREGRAVSQVELLNVSDSDNTLFKNEQYFLEAIQLKDGDIYVGHMSGVYVSMESFHSGTQWWGVLRFAMPVFSEVGELLGVVELGLDGRHLEEFTGHIVPTEERFAVSPDPGTGNYAYLIDDQAFSIAHPNDYLQMGSGPQGEDLGYVTSVEELGNKPVRLDMLGFLDENLASIPALAAQGESGSLMYVWDNKEKIVAYAPVPYYGGNYAEPAGFGWVGIGANLDTFYEAATLVKQEIEGEVRNLAILTVAILLFGGAILVPVTGFLARGIAAPIQHIIEAAHSVESGDFDTSTLTPLLDDGRADEIGLLARVFKRMADTVHQREEQLHQTIRHLRIEIDETKKDKAVMEITESEYFRELQKKVRLLRTKRRDG
jgi:HAMP domain-containing protein